MKYVTATIAISQDSYQTSRPHSLYWFNLLPSVASLVQASALLLVILVSMLLTSLVLSALGTRLATNEWVHNCVTAKLDKGLCCEDLWYKL